MKIFHIAFLLALIFSGGKSFANEEFSTHPTYKLGSGDKLKITVFGEEGLSGEFEIDGSGTLAFPLIGSVKAGGIDPRSLEEELTVKLSGDYLVHPRVSVEVLNFRPFFILGEVNEPGSYPYVDGLTVVNAIALAGGYTHRAKTDKVLIVRGKGKDRKELYSKEADLVSPGDSIMVKERFF